MKHLLIIVLLVSTTATAWSQESETRSVGSFTGVKVAEGVDVYLKKGDKESVKVEVTGTKPENVVSEVSGGYLRIGMRHGKYQRTSIKVYVTYVNLEKLSASSGANIFADAKIKSRSLEISTSSAGSVEITVECDALNISASSAGQVDVQGKTKSLTASVSTGGQLNAYELEADNAEAEASTGAEMKITVKESLTAHASSGGSIRYHGNPSKSMTDSSSGGSVKKSN